jgi:hypothetical protein
VFCHRNHGHSSPWSFVRALRADVILVPLVPFDHTNPWSDERYSHTSYFRVDTVEALAGLVICYAPQTISVPPTAQLTDVQVLEAYSQGLGEKKWKPIEQKLKEGESHASGSACRAPSVASSHSEEQATLMA